MPDARSIRSRARLHAAVLELAADEGIGGLTVTAIAERAGVHRSTFYEHAATPLQLLQAALAVELDALRAQLEGVPPERARDAVTEVTRGVLRHVDAHAAIYAHLDDVDGIALQSFLSDHFQESSRLLAREGVIDLAALGDAAAGETAIRYVADGVVGAVGVWLRGPEPRDPEALLTLLGRLVPAWWPLG